MAVMLGTEASLRTLKASWHGCELVEIRRKGRGHRKPSADVHGGDFIGPDGFAELRGAPTCVSLAPAALDAETGLRLWQLSEDLTGVRFPPPVADEPT